jgi:hypothetical protein
MSCSQWTETPNPSGIDLLLDAGLICFAVLLSFPTLRDLVMILRARDDADRTSAEPPYPEAELDNFVVNSGAIPMSAKGIRPTACEVENVTA